MARKWIAVLRNLKDERPEFVESIAANEVTLADFRKQVGVGRETALQVIRAIKDEKEPDPEDMIPGFVRYLIKGRTAKVLQERYGAYTDWLLEQKHEGYTLFRQRNRYGEPVYILLPIIAKEVKIKPKKWEYHVAPKTNGLTEPYMVAQLKEKGEIIIAPLFDIHYGHKAHRHEKFLSYIRWIEETPNVYGILGGDLMENALDDGRGMSYDQPIAPQSQLDEMTAHLAPIAHKLIVATTGNHEERTYKKTGIDVMRVMAERLKVPYFDGPVFLTILAGGYKWNLHVFHGRGNSQTKGGKMNSAGRSRTWTDDIQFRLSGHVHDRVCESETTIFPNPYTCTLEYLPTWTIVCPSFLNWQDTYAYRAGYAPPASGGVTLNLNAKNGEYAASLT